MSKFVKLLVAVFAVVGLAGCGTGESPYFPNTDANASWREDQSQMRGMLYAAIYADGINGEFACDKLPEVVEKSTSYRTVWSQAEFRRGFAKKCAELQQLRKAVRDATEAKAIAEKVAKAQAAQKAARKARQQHQPYHCRCQ